MKQIAMKVNSANLVKSLKFSFTNKTTVLGELMQNARRANATQVVFEFAPETKILRVTDDGCGIDSIEKLLTVAESGWSADVVSQEHPFGIGFLSALYACRHITVVSKSGRISTDTDNILSFKPIAITPVTDCSGTTITMVGVELELSAVKEKLEQLAMGFNIPIVFNGENLNRFHALDSGLDFVETEIGAIHLSGLQDSHGSNCEFEVYLQGLPIYRSHNYAGYNRHITHLDSSRFYARLPDRDKLIDEQDVVGLIKTVLKREIENRLISLKSTLSANEFVKFYEVMRHWGLLSLLNDVPVAPREVLQEISDYPVCNEEVYSHFMACLREPLTRLDIEKLGIVSFDNDIQCEGAALHLFAKEKGHLVYEGGLDNGHWIHSLVRNLSSEDLTIEMVNNSHHAVFEGEWINVFVRFCDAYRIKIGNDVVEIASDALYRGQDHEDDVIMPKGDGTGYVLKQISSYRSEYDEFQESTHETDMYAFSSFVVANTTKEPAVAMKRLLPGFAGCPSLYNKSFTVTLDDKGAVASVIAA